MAPASPATRRRRLGASRFAGSDCFVPGGMGAGRRYETCCAEYPGEELRGRRRHGRPACMLHAPTAPKGDVATFVYVGTFTGATGAQGISVERMDVATGALALVQTVPGLLSPSFLALHPSGRYLYAVERHWTPERRDVGAVAASRVAGMAGRLALPNRQPSGGVSPAHVSVHPGGRFALAAHYGNAQVAVLPIGPDGYLGGASDIAQHAGRGPDAVRQEGPHAHFRRRRPERPLHPGVRPRHRPRRGLHARPGQRDAPPQRPSLRPGDPRRRAAPPGLPPERSHRLHHQRLDSTLSAFAFDAARGTCRSSRPSPRRRAG